MKAELIHKAETKLSKTIPSILKDIAQAFKRFNKSIYVVGGAVRDALMDQTPHDFDLSTDAKPEEMQQIFNSIGIKYNLKDVKFGIVIIHIKNITFEICTFRKDLSPTRDTEVELVSTLEEDSARRDLTYNAIYYDILTSKIIDPVNGVDDLLNNKTRMVGNAKERLEEDSIRTLRAVRFCLRYRHDFTEDLKQAIRNSQLDGLDPTTGLRKPISRERIWDEFKKAHGQVYSFGEYLLTINDLGLFQKIFPNGTKLDIDFINKNKNLNLNLSNWFAGLLFPMGAEAGLKMRDIKSTSDIAIEVQFLVDIARKWETLTPIEWKKAWGRKSIPTSFIWKWNELKGISQDIPKLIEYRFKVTPLDFPNLKGKELGDAMLDKENELFKNKWN